MITISIPIRPKPAPRPRFSKNGTYNASDYTNYKIVIATIIKGYMNKHKIIKSDKPLVAEFEFIYKYPKSWSKKKVASNPIHDHTVDLDNLVKTYKDAMNKVAYNDDSQIFKETLSKRYGESDEVIIKIEEIK
jgi:Holliday junction resolvase RusA-like endonuclease